MLRVFARIRRQHPISDAAILIVGSFGRRSRKYALLHQHTIILLEITVQYIN